MTEILYGRRCGSSKEAKKININDLPKKLGSKISQDHNLTAKTQDNELDPKKVCILTKNDMDRIFKQLNKKKDDEERRRLACEERSMLKEKSRQQVSQWDNTVLGLRQKKLETRRLREDKLEEERKAIDIEEETFNSLRRKEIIDKAKTQQYYQTDRVKNFHSALLLTEVMKERDAQIELKKYKANANKGSDNQWVAYERQQLEEAILKEQEEARCRIVKNHENAKDLLRQIDKHQKVFNEQKKEEEFEGKELRKLTAHYEMEKKQLEEIKQGESLQLKQDNIRQIAEVKRMKELKLAQEEEEDEECRIFAAAKRKMMRLRAEKEKEIFSEKQDKLNKIREKLYLQMQQHVQDEGERLEKAITEAEEKRDREEKEKQLKIKKGYEEATKHMLDKMKRNEDLKKQEKIDEVRRLQVQKETDEIFEKAEREKRQRRLDGEKKRKEHNWQEKEKRSNESILDKKRSLEVEKKNEELLKLEEDQFAQYAKKVIDHCDKNGRNTYPLKRAAGVGIGGGLGPILPGKDNKNSYLVCDQTCQPMPSYQGKSTEETKKVITNEEGTDKRLGFVW